MALLVPKKACERERARATLREEHENLNTNAIFSIYKIEGGIGGWAGVGDPLESLGNLCSPNRKKIIHIITCARLHPAAVAPDSPVIIFIQVRVCISFMFFIPP